ncbi:MAG: helix-turn-helix domain-containing protein [Candidatus Buchananbacteria bacterium]
MLKEVLKRAGLHDKEVKIYLAGLRAGPVLASFLAKKTGISRQNTYDLLKKLESRGLVSSSGRRYNTKFVMEDPINLKSYLNRQRRALEKTEKDLELVMPEIENLTDKSGIIPKIKFYEGKESIKNLVLESLHCLNKEILAVGSPSDYYLFVSADFDVDYAKQRVKKGIKIKIIKLAIPEQDPAKKFFPLATAPEELRESRYAPPDILLPSAFYLYDNKVVFISSVKENFAFMIESEEYKQMMLTMFNLLWNISKPADEDAKS